VTGACVCSTQRARKQGCKQGCENSPPGAQHRFPRASLDQLEARVQVAFERRIEALVPPRAGSVQKILGVHWTPLGVRRHRWLLAEDVELAVEEGLARSGRA
jgi:hypothetical protein